MTDLDVTNLIAETNKQLRRNQQIHPDDPILASVILNKQILNVQVDAVKKKLDDTIQQLTAVSDQQIERAETRAEAIAMRLIVKSGNNIEQQLDAAARRWEERLRKAGEETETAVRQAAWLAWAGGCLIAIWACTMIGSRLGTDLFTLVHHVK